jgi:hypothetical protein
LFYSRFASIGPHLILRSERSERLEGWQQTRCGLPPFETPPYGRLLRVRLLL